eukprot:CAMPEP_0172535392 /NCGR_PEP_ID=MMETSP1067-20121228/7426_1 /TAXON_ID=265564 ORGANISM="Thalassiosira punctigera, Strain Tpunct2005C2" /NCGR_SAMPLE_ID=MMETSP1067 /ASSEMBLY_ACC=CAM_ASM_000444 /LENGTH=307 /DNA_ID=CAMNT_0013320325 /DNA_START=303 /DNA_END=1226 /DNA_ORIENTATION=-
MVQKSHGIGGCIFTLILLGVGGFLIWKYALQSPESLTEAQDGIGDLADSAGDKFGDLKDSDLAEKVGGIVGDLGDAAGDKLDELGVDWDFGDFTDVLGDLTNIDFGDLFNSDPKVGDNSTLNWMDSVVQENNGGLHLTLLNALDDTWQDEFDQAVADWQSSDALVLTKQQVAVDHDCNRVEGVMVVCNANFGATGWVGINENIIQGKRITSSVSKMNEYYLNNADYDHRRYTMCHELGHGFGLPHTDENPYNTNLENCLDYTNKPETNVLPGEVNMAKLRGMYLTSKNRRVLREDGTVMETTHLVRR